MVREHKVKALVLFELVINGWNCIFEAILSFRDK